MLAEAKDNRNHIPNCGARTHYVGLATKEVPQVLIYKMKIIIVYPFKGRLRIR